MLNYHAALLITNHLVTNRLTDIFYYQKKYLVTIINYLSSFDLKGRMLRALRTAV
jgi:hypothetical protein